MFSDKRYLAVIPAYNEADTVGLVIHSLRSEAPQFDILVIDDGSTDRTADLADAAGVPVLRHPFNLGIGGAVQAGFEYARSEGYDYMVQVDGDGQHRADQIHRLVDAMEKDRVLDMVCGSRFLTENRYPAPVSR